MTMISGLMIHSESRWLCVIITANFTIDESTKSRFCISCKNNFVKSNNLDNEKDININDRLDIAKINMSKGFNLIINYLSKLTKNPKIYPPKVSKIPENEVFSHRIKSVGKLFFWLFLSIIVPW